MYNFEECRKAIEEKITEISYPPSPKGLYEPIDYILKIGGKRIRPVLTLMAHNLFKENIEEAIPPALGIEVFHNFTLLHDDVMDNADIRRGQETVHKKWNENTAILSGDAMMILAYDFISQSAKSCCNEVFQLFNQTALEVCEGQQFDMNFEKRMDVSTEEYLEMIKLKTSVLIAAALQIGGITGGANHQQQTALYQFGLNVGLAFQLQDDYLDVFASEEKFGKAIGGDIVQNKKTYLLISALNASNKATVDQLKWWIEKKEFDRQEKVDAVRNIYLELGIGDQVQKLSKEYFAQGIQHLQLLGIGNERKAPLQSIVSKLMYRDM